MWCLLVCETKAKLIKFSVHHLTHPGRRGKCGINKNHWNDYLTFQGKYWLYEKGQQFSYQLFLRLVLVTPKIDQFSAVKFLINPTFNDKPKVPLKRRLAESKFTHIIFKISFLLLSPAAEGLLRRWKENLKSMT